MKKILLLLPLLFNLSFASENSIICGEQSIEHCIKCFSGENSDTCEICEDKYFPIFNGLSCVACNNSTYGQIACEGNCDGSNYAKSKFPFCERNGCKEGYYNLNGLCTKCSEESPHCSKCTYEMNEDKTKGKFICQKCESEEYGLTQLGTCQLCSMENCKSCHYNDNSKVECDQCVNNYYKSSNGECKKCREVSISRGWCLICSDNNTDYDSGSCYCNGGSIKVGQSHCEKCPYNCKKCEYNYTLNTTQCLDCYDNYVLNKDKTCTYCGNGCKRCSINEKYEANCTWCYSGTFLEYNKCLICNDGCSLCEINQSSPYKNESLCTVCKFPYAMNPENQCTYCRYSDTGGEGCYDCTYNAYNSRFECLKCINNNYTFINNIHQCLRNTDINQVYLYGCLQAIYFKENNTYECLKCRDGFIQIVNDKTCRKIKEIGISSYCFEVENLGTPNNSLYSCTKCQNGTTHVEFKSNGKKDCYSRSNNFHYCIEGEIEENGKHLCTKCVELASINNSSLCDCNFDSFGKNNELCYKCDDKNIGIEGCLASKGCNYIHSNNQLDCNQCEKGYFKYSTGQCYYCENEIKFCNKCHFDLKLKCDNCISIYSPNEEKDKCVIDECQEYPEISPGCIICIDKLEEYLINNKCQSCKYGYFKTRNETCVYCSSEEYGGPACYECGYDIDKDGIETDNIICKDCYSKDKYINFNYEIDYNKYYYSNSVLSPNGKCYNCKYSLSESCLKCEFNKDDKLVCTFCAPGYYLDSEGKCISIINKIKKINNCDHQQFSIGTILYDFYDSDIFNNYLYFKTNNDKINYNNNFYKYNEYIKKNLNSIKSSCYYCHDGYYLDENGECIIFDFKNCIGRNNIKKGMNICKSLCNKKSYPFIYMKLKNNSIDFDYEYNNSLPFGLNNMVDILNNFDMLTDNSKNLVENMSLCYNNLTFQVDGCQKVIYVPKKQEYQCFECKDQYIMDYEKHICHKIINNYKDINNCVTENIGTELSPVYSCIKCNNNSDILVTLDAGVKSCVKDHSLENCIEVIVNTTYINPIYNCESCKFNYISYFSKYYERKICQSISEEIIRNKTISLESFEGEEYINADEEGNCKKNYFTPDGKKCYKCDNKNIGAPGCKGECSFSLLRNNTILCESECKDGYIEASKGICQTCDSINKGCYDCHYEDNYPTYYLGIRNTRRFHCNFCKEGFILSPEGRCLTCSDLNINNCEKCGKDEETGKYICKECSKYYYKNEFGYCQHCNVNYVILNDKCIRCNDINNGGIEGCRICEKNENNKIICKQCTDRYILFTDNNTCIERGINEELNQFDNCLELKSENYTFVCSRCKLQYSLLKEGNGTKCVYIQNLYDPMVYSHYFHHFYYDIFEKNDNDYKDYVVDDYTYKQNYFYPCKESINLGTKENPLYSCNKCYSVFDNEDSDNYYSHYYQYYYDKQYKYKLEEYYQKGFYGDSPVRIIDNEIFNISYCMRTFKDTKNCTEAIYKISKGQEIYNCTKCSADNILIYNKQLDIYYCSYKEIEKKKCLVDYCKNCISDNNYFCSDCLTSDYEVNKYSGSCVKKTEIVPAVTWKDIYRLNMNDQKEINGQIISGLSLNLRGITSSQINNRHAFLVYLTFKIKYGLRNLEEVQEILNITALCEIQEGVEKSEDFANIVDYECIGNSTVSENYTLIGIEEPDNDQSIIIGNLNEINEMIKIGDDLIKKNTPNYTYVIMDNMIFFDINNDNYIINSSIPMFKFSLNGTINKPFNLTNNHNGNILRSLDYLECLDNIEFEMVKIENTAICSFCSEENLNASLTCTLILNKDIEEQNLSFATSEIKINGTAQSIYIPKLNQINLNYIKEKDEDNDNSYNETKPEIKTEIIKSEIVETDVTPVIGEKLKRKKSSNYGWIIGLSIGGGVIFLGALTAVFFYLLRIKKNKKIFNVNNISEQKFGESDVNISKN